MASAAAPADLAQPTRRRGETPIVILLTDGRSNVARDGAPGRPAAGRDALESAQAFRREELTAMLIDTSRRAARAGLDEAAPR